MRVRSLGRKDPLEKSMMTHSSFFFFFAGPGHASPASWTAPGPQPLDTFQFSRLENAMDRGAQQATLHKATKSRTRLKQLSTHTCTAAPHNTEASPGPSLIWSLWMRCFLHLVIQTWNMLYGLTCLHLLVLHGHMGRNQLFKLFVRVLQK